MTRSSFHALKRWAPGQTVVLLLSVHPESGSGRIVHAGVSQLSGCKKHADKNDTLTTAGSEATPHSPQSPRSGAKLFVVQKLSDPLFGVQVKLSDPSRGTPSQPLNLVSLVRLEPQAGSKLRGYAQNTRSARMEWSSVKPVSAGSAGPRIQCVGPRLHSQYRSGCRRGYWITRRWPFFARR